MGKKLSAVQIEQYEREGFVFPVDAFSHEEAARCRARLEESEALVGRRIGKGFNFKPHLLFTWVS